MVWPVMPLAASMHRKALSWAISSSFTRRCSGALAWAVAMSSSKLAMPEAARVRIGPGETACTRMFLLPSSSDM